MNRIAVAVLALLAVAWPALAQETGKDPSPRDAAAEKYFEAYYLENGKRDLDAAEKAYENLPVMREGLEDFRVRKELGLARIAARRGDGDAERRFRIAAAFLEEIGVRVGEDTYVELKGELDAGRELLKAASKEDELRRAIEQSIATLGYDEYRKSGIDALPLYGARAVPLVADALRSTNPKVVAAAAEVLFRIPDDAAVDALVGVFEDDDVVFPEQVTGQLNNAEGRHVPVFRRALADSRRQVREKALDSLACRAFADSAMRDYTFGLLREGDPETRRRILGIGGSSWNPNDVLLAGKIALEDPVIRDGWTKLVRHRWQSGGSFELRPEAEALIPDLLPLAGKCLWYQARRASPEVLARAAEVALAQPDPELRNTAVKDVAKGHVRATVDIRDALLTAARLCYGLDDYPEWRTVFDHCLGAFVKTAPTDEENGAVLAAFLAWLTDHDGLRRGEAVASVIGYLARYPNPIRVAAWAALDSDEDREEWLSTFGRGLGAQAVPMARASLDGTAVMRRAALAILAQRLEPAERASLLRPLLDDPDPEVVGLAISSAVYGPETDWYEPLLKTVKRSPVAFAERAVKAVAAGAPPEVTRRFTDEVLSLLADASAGVRANVWALQGDAITDEMILAALATKEHYLLTRAAPLAAKRHLLAAWPLLLESKDDIGTTALDQIRDYHVRMKQYRDLEASREKDAFGKAEVLARSGEARHRMAAVYALAALGDRAAVATLLDLVDDPDEPVRAAAFDALKRLSARSLSQSEDDKPGEPR